MDKKVSNSLPWEVIYNTDDDVTFINFCNFKSMNHLNVKDFCDDYFAQKGPHGNFHYVYVKNSHLVQIQILHAKQLFPQLQVTGIQVPYEINNHRYAEIYWVHGSKLQPTQKYELVHGITLNVVPQSKKIQSIFLKLF